MTAVTVIVIIALVLLWLRPESTAVQEEQSASSTIKKIGFVEMLQQKFKVLIGLDNKTDKNLPLAIKPIRIEPKYSRISFFFTKPKIFSAAIPAEWEGRYVTEEKNNVIDFYITPAKQSPQKFFSIYYFDKLSGQADGKNYQFAKNYPLVFSRNNYDLRYQVYPVKVSSSTVQKEYEKMITNVPLVISSVKEHSPTN